MTNIITSSNGYISRAIRTVDTDVINKLEEFYTKTEDLSRDYNTYAYALVQASLKINKSLETRKQLQELLVNIGFKSYKVSKMIAVAIKSQELIDNKSDAAEWYGSLPASTAYTLAKADDNAFGKIWANDSKWGQEKISQHQAEQLVTKYNSPDKLPRGKNFDPVDPKIDNLEKAKKLLADYPFIIEEIDKVINTLV